MSSNYTYFFGISCSISITKDREQLRTENKNYLEIKQTSTHENIHPTLLLPGNGARKMSFSISKSVEPNKELKVEQIFPHVLSTTDTTLRTLDVRFT